MLFSTVRDTSALFIIFGGISMKSIGKKIFSTIVVLTAVSLLFLGVLASTLNYKST